MKNIRRFSLIALLSVLATATYSYHGQKNIQGHWESEDGYSTVVITKENSGIHIENLRTGKSVHYDKTGWRTYRNHTTKVKWDKNDNVLIVKKRHRQERYYHPVDAWNRHVINDTDSHRYRYKKRGHKRHNGHDFNNRNRHDRHTHHINVNGEWEDHRNHSYYNLTQRGRNIMLTKAHHNQRSEHDNEIYYPTHGREGTYENEHGEIIEIRDRDRIYLYGVDGRRTKLDRVKGCR